MYSASYDYEEYGDIQKKLKEHNKNERGNHRLVGARAASHDDEAPFLVAINPWG